jgi:hypothetical protein
MKQPVKPYIQELIERTPLGRLNLRGKLTAGNMLITFLVVIVMGLYVYLRIQDASGQLITSVEENARTRAEEGLINANGEQTALLDSFFEGMSRNTLIAASSVQTILDDEKLDDGSYWNARSSLVRLSSGSWDNDNTEVASIFIPAEVELSNPLAQKLNLLKHVEFIFPPILNGNPDIVCHLLWRRE